MSHYEIFKPTKEAIEKYKKETRNSGSFRNYENTLLLTCLVDPKVERAYNFDEVLFNIRLSLSGLALEIERKIKESVVKDFEKNGKIEFAGWRYSQEEAEMSREEAIEMAEKELGILSVVVKTPDFFTGDHFYEKRNVIEEQISSFKDNVSDAIIYEIMDELKDFKVQDTDIEDIEGVEEF